ncbi:DNA mismatch repair protein MSH4 isoform X2 [Histomonas meleagridis]|uniref:DNA mismatch repair protein MSH4 isoform X2 n=1 Tax=Histomonas meleagridis TaxID=135588 RepID=UPI00355AC59D|nr:DNA mismatch repair protein MSH4 isoform X2 [Histomonas meleagridis]KAH0798219.1 DNA mismatch repair protein MSH4 isoform X2 [Histomonas meleagridis]
MRCSTPSSVRVTPRIGSRKMDTPKKLPKVPTTPATDGETRQCYIAFIENGSREVGAALLTIYPPSLTLFQYLDTALYSHSNNLLEVYHPIRVLIPSNSSKSPLSQLLITQIPQANISEVQRSRFSDTIGSNLLYEYGNENNYEKLTNNYLSLSSAAACLHYIQTEIGIEIISHSLRISFKPLEGHVMIDPSTLHNFKTQYETLSNKLSEFLEIDNDNITKHKNEAQFVYSIKSGIISILDVTRKSFEDSLTKIYEHSKQLSEKYNIKISIKNNKSRRYYLSINKSQLEKKNDNTIVQSVSDTINQMVYHSGYLIPQEMIHIFEVGNSITGSTYELMLLNKQNESAQNDCIQISQKFIESKIDDIRTYISDIYKISEVIGFVDSLLSLSIVATENNNYTRPKIISEPIYVLKNARHPIFEQLYNTSSAKSISSILFRNESKFIPNDLELTSMKNMIILRGVNMSGKSTYLQMLIQIIIMAQIGSYIPCDSAVISPFELIFTRCGTLDSIEGNASAFLLEMKEMSNILSHATDKTLIAIDEPCTSTSMRDGIGISFAYLEYLLSLRSFVICATHFEELGLLSNLYPQVALKEMRIRKRSNEENNFEFLYNIGDGSNAKSGYGVELAANYLPQNMITYAKTCFREMAAETVHQTQKQKSPNQSAKKLIQKLIALQNSSLDNESLREALMKIRKQCRY